MEHKNLTVSNINISIKSNGNTVKIFSDDNINEIATEIIRLKHLESQIEKSNEILNIEIDLASIKINPIEKNDTEDKDNVANYSTKATVNNDSQPLHPFFVNHTSSKKLSKIKQKISFDNSHKILLFSPHPDDEILGACALLHKSFTENININVVYLTSGKTAGNINIRQNEAKEGIKILNGKEENLLFANMPFYERKDRSINEDDYKYIKDIIKQYTPNVIFICADVFDPNKTHKKCFDVLTKVLLEKGYYDIDVYFYYSVWYTPNEDQYTHILPYDYNLYRLKVFAMLEHKSQMHTNYMGNNSLPFYVRGVMRDEKFGSLNDSNYCEVYYKLERE